MVEDDFSDLNIESHLDSYAITLRQPFYRSPAAEFAAFLTGNVKRNETYLLGEPFSFSPGAVNGRSDSAVVRVGQEYFYRDTEQAAALRSTWCSCLKLPGHG